MKIKLIVDLDGISKKYIATKIINNDHYLIEYKERPDVLVSCYIYQDFVKIIKSGNIKLEVLHKLKLKTSVDYIVMLGTNEFSGSSEILTSRLEINDENIIIEYLRDEELVKLKLTIANSKASSTLK